MDGKALTRMENQVGDGLGLQKDDLSEMDGPDGGYHRECIRR